MVVYAPYPRSETRVRREAEALIDRGYQVDVICPKRRGEASIDVHRGVTIYRVAKTWVRKKGLVAQFFEYLGFFMLASIKLTWLHLRQRYDAVQVHNLPDFLVFVALIPKLTGCRVILDLHDLMPEFYQGRLKQASDGILKRLILLQENLSCRFADHVITVTEPWRQALIKRGLPAEKCSVVMNLADSAIFHPSSRESAPSKDSSGFRLFYHGYMPERYGLDLVLRAMDRLRAQIPGLHLTLVGGGEHLQALKHLATELNLDGGQVEFLPTVPADQLPSLIASADLGVVPYRNDVFTDSLLPTKLMEYAIMGLPSIVARTSTISLYFDESMVQFFEPNDLDDLVRCIFDLYSDRERREQLAEGIRGFHHRYNWAAASAEYAASVERLRTR